ncbi:hypothetical protein JX266_003411 [Neoarthrinium moseri]|nr:hypothetical protein JX266_003411 [Neoarthrinium moseri]
MDAITDKYICSFWRDSIRVLSPLAANSRWTAPKLAAYKLDDDTIDFFGLKIKFHRTIRVRDNEYTSQPPPDLGTFPLYKARDYPNTLPDEFSKGGALLPMHQKEAMWMSFTANMPFMIKVYAGGVNVVSGEHRAENLDTTVRRLKLHLGGQNIQDYVVAPKQLWLDRFATSPAVVKQLVTMPIGTDYSVETQLTGHDAGGGLQIEVTPIKMPTPFGDFKVFINCLTGNRMTIPCSPNDSVLQIMNAIYVLQKLPISHQSLIYGGRYMQRDRTLADYNVDGFDSILQLVPRPLGDRTLMQEANQMGHTSGGETKQVICKDTLGPDQWDRDATMAIPVHILNSQDFHRVTSRAPPPCPITASDYAKAGLPCFDMHEEATDISGNFNDIKRVNEIEQEQGITGEPKPAVTPNLVRTGEYGYAIDIAGKVHDCDGLINPAGPFRKFRSLNDLYQELRGLKLEDVKPEPSGHGSVEDE